MYPDGNGLYLWVGDTGRRSWILRYRHQGKRRDMGLGSASTFSLAEARERARVARQALADGLDPLARRDADRAVQRQQQALTFSRVALDYIDAHRASWSNPKHAEQWRTSLENHAFPTLGDMPVAQVDTKAVVDALRPIWETRHETATRIRGRIERILDSAIVQNLRASPNPARWRGHLDALLARKAGTKGHHAALPWQQVPEFMQALREQEGLAAVAVQFIILTACRTSEALNARWCEVDVEAGVWTVPAERMKARREHRVPLAPQVLDLLRSLPKGEPTAYVFPGTKGKPLSNMCGLALLKRMGRRADLTVHGFRSSFRDWAGEATAHPHEVAEQALAHTIANKAEAAYRRGDLLEKRRTLMSDWASFCSTTRTEAGVVELGARRRG